MPRLCLIEPTTIQVLDIRNFKMDFYKAWLLNYRKFSLHKDLGHHIQNYTLLKQSFVFYFFRVLAQCILLLNILFGSTSSYQVTPYTCHLGSRQKMKRLIQNLPEELDFILFENSDSQYSYIVLPININNIQSHLNFPMRCHENQERFVISLLGSRMATTAASFQYFYACLSYKQ